MSLLSQRELANALVFLGCLSSALELYERLEMWEELAECLQSVGRTGRAEEVLRQQIAVNATPTLWCLLGDVTKVTLIERLASMSVEVWKYFSLLSLFVFLSLSLPLPLGS